MSEGSTTHVRIGRAARDDDDSTYTDPRPITPLVGILLAVVWLAATALSIVTMLILFVWTDTPAKTDDLFWTLLLGVGAPVFGAVTATRVILNRD